MVSSTPTYATREEWLQAATNRLRPIMARRGSVVPDTLRIGVGWSSKGARSTVLGQCWPASSSADGIPEVTIVVSQHDGLRVLDILAHELVHSSLDCSGGHGAKFTKRARALDLQGKPTETVAGPIFARYARRLIRELGAWPGDQGLTAEARRAKTQTTRMIKVECFNCGITFRLTRKWITPELRGPFGEFMHCPGGCGETAEVLAVRPRLQDS